MDHSHDPPHHAHGRPEPEPPAEPGYPGHPEVPHEGGTLPGPHGTHAGHDRDAPAKPHAHHRPDGHDQHAGHGGHDKHAGHSVEMFRDKFWITLLLTLPTLVWGHMLQGALGYTAPRFPGSHWIPAVFGTAVFLYGGVVFLRGAAHELKDRLPGMMTLISLAITVAFVFSAAVTLGFPGMPLWEELATLVTIMVLGHWIEMRSISQAQAAQRMPSTENTASVSPPVARLALRSSSASWAGTSGAVSTVSGAEPPCSGAAPGSLPCIIAFSGLAHGLWLGWNDWPKGLWSETPKREPAVGPGACCSPGSWKGRKLSPEP